ncbi:DNA repair protein RadA, partial [Thermus scotoductus]
MAKTSYTCVECGYKTPKPLGRCPACGAWESFQEVAPSPISLSQVNEAEEKRFSSGLSE